MRLFTVRDFFENDLIDRKNISAGMCLIYEHAKLRFLSASEDVWESLFETLRDNSDWSYDWEVAIFPKDEAALLMGLEDIETLETIEAAYERHYKR